MNWNKIDHIEDNKYNFPGNWIFIHYYEALNILFRIENSLRIIVYITLKVEFQEKWSELSITSDDEDKSTISSIARKRISQDDNFAYLGYKTNNPLLYLTSGELIRIITSDSYWKFFKQYFLGSKEIMKNKLDEIGNIRNSLAHFRPIKEDDIDLIKQNAKHTLSKIENTIVQLINCPDTVPSNTTDDWYNNLISLGNEYVSFQFRQSKDGRWIKIILNFHTKVDHKFIYDDLYYFTTLQLNVNNLIDTHHEIKKYLLFASEVIPYAALDFEAPAFTKRINLTYERKSLNENSLLIKETLEKIINGILTECALILQDSLAQGKFVEGTRLRARLLKKDKPANWSVENRNLLLSKISEDDPVEFWGSIYHASDNFISDTDTFPWMKVNIGEDKELPF